MAAYNWNKIMDMKSDIDLQEIIDSNPENLEIDAIEAARNEIDKRKQNPKLIAKIDFPDKPTFNDTNQSISKSIISIVIFIAAFYLIFDWEFEYIFALTGVILIHELGHFMAMRFFNYSDLSILFIPLIGALASGQKRRISIKQNIIISFSGPLPGVFAGTVLVVLSLTSGIQRLDSIGYIFILINLFNLLPIMPLDGGHILKNLFLKSNEKLSIVFTWISIVAVILIAVSLESYFLLIIPFFLYMQIKNQSQTRKIKESLRTKGFDLNKDYRDLSKEEYWLIRDEFALQLPEFSKFIEPKRYMEVPAENRVNNLMKQIFQLEPRQDLKIRNKVLYILLWLSAFILPFIVIIYTYISLGLIE